MFNNDILKSALLAIPAGLPSIGGAIGSATTTVDLASSFLITQTVAMTATATLPNPSDPRAGDRANVGNSPVSTQNVLINGSTLTPGHFAEFLWSGTAWLVTQVASISSGFTDDFVEIFVGNPRESGRPGPTQLHAYTGSYFGTLASVIDVPGPVTPSGATPAAIVLGAGNWGTNNAFLAILDQGAAGNYHQISAQANTASTQPGIIELNAGTVRANGPKDCFLEFGGEMLFETVAGVDHYRVELSPLGTNMRMKYSNGILEGGVGAVNAAVTIHSDGSIDIQTAPGKAFKINGTQIGPLGP